MNRHALRPVAGATALLLAALTGQAHAQAAAPAATPAYTLTTNFAVASQYIFRGMSYSQKRPALQGGFDFVHASGAYAGIWGSSVSGEALGNATAEFDFYGGYAASVGDLAYDVGLLQFTFPRGKIGGESYNTLEAYGSLTWQMVNLKYSRTLGDYFGMNANSMGFGDNSKGSQYFEANVNWTFVPGWTLNLHAGRQKVKGYGAYSFSDFKAGVTVDLAEGWQLSAAGITTNGQTDLYRINGVDTAGDKWLVMLKRTF